MLLVDNRNLGNLVGGPCWGPLVGRVNGHLKVKDDVQARVLGKPCEVRDDLGVVHAHIPLRLRRETVVLQAAMNAVGSIHSNCDDFHRERPSVQF
jgi:hypothetical protein